MFVTSGLGPLERDVSALAATGDVLPDGTESAATAGEDPHGTAWVCAETAITNRSRNSRVFIAGISVFPTIMERCGD
jgi:hypothetical protein